ncbi:hypothetical protein QBC38DRAFT_513436 [Podospora fimiseda]|uniref:DUF7779 domain-containing protein n=1 Tax=Podospora fimiseda TaxID=252190 RepID=A0AAN6YSE5_9PEZI|nr:hypothetical protein QBC38DRAFT_513436 [Podospora fimiseda]
MGEYQPLIADLSAKFEQSTTVKAILTIHEEKPTPRYRGPFWTGKKEMVSALQNLLDKNNHLTCNYGGKLLGQELAEIATLKAEKNIVSATDYNGIAEFDQHSKVYREILGLLRGCPQEIIARSTPEGTDPTESNARRYVVRAGNLWASTESNADSTNNRNFEIIIAESKLPEMPCYVRTPTLRNPTFVGRNEIIRKIDSVLLAEDSGAGSALRSYALCGFGGLGKTQIATYYAFERESSFDAIFWVQADGPGKLYKSFRDIAEALNLTDDGDQGNMVVCREKVFRWLSDPRKQPTVSNVADGGAGATSFAKWLMIFDNADNLDIVPEFLPPTTYGSILITSRDPMAKTLLATDGIDLPPMTNSECARLLQIKVGESGSPEADRAALKLVEKLGNVPLAISQIATQIQRKHMTIDEYLNHHAEGSLISELNKVKALPPKEQYSFTVATVWAVEQFSRPALGIMRVMAFMDPDGVAENILQQKAPVSVSLPQDPVYQYAYPEPRKEYFNARTEILRTSVVRKNNDTKSLEWHRNIQQVVRDKMSREEQKVYYEFAVDLLFRAWQYADHYDRFTRENFKRQRCDEVLPNVKFILEAYGPILGQTKLPLQKARQLVKLLQETGWYLVQESQYDSVKPVFELAIKICKDHGDEMNDLLADTAFSYARYGEETNMDPQLVFDYCLQFHELRKQLDDGSMESIQDLATSHTSLSQGYLLLEQPEEAVKQCQMCMDIEANFPEQKDEGVISQFAHIYQAWGMCGLKKYEEAARLCLKVIDYRTKNFGPQDKESIKLGLALQCLGVAREKQGLLSQSVDAYKKALLNFKDILGPDSFRVAQINLKLGEIAGKRDAPQVARMLFTQAIQTFERTPYYKPELARALYKLSEFNDSIRKTGFDHPAVDVDYKRAVELFYELQPQASKGKPLGGEEFDMLVRFWSR